jgi:hypothetical protein
MQKKIFCRLPNWHGGGGQSYNQSIRQSAISQSVRVTSSSLADPVLSIWDPVRLSISDPVRLSISNPVRLSITDPVRLSMSDPVRFQLGGQTSRSWCPVLTSGAAEAVWRRQWLPALPRVILSGVNEGDGKGDGEDDTQRRIQLTTTCSRRVAGHLRKAGRHARLEDNNAPRGATPISQRGFMGVGTTSKKITTPPEVRPRFRNAGLWVWVLRQTSFLE